MEKATEEAERRTISVHEMPTSSPRDLEFTKYTLIMLLNYTFPPPCLVVSDARWWSPLPYSNPNVVAVTPISAVSPFCILNTLYVLS